MNYASSFFDSSIPTLVFFWLLTSGRQLFSLPAPASFFNVLSSVAGKLKLVVVLLDGQLLSLSLMTGTAVDLPLLHHLFTPFFPRT